MQYFQVFVDKGAQGGSEFVPVSAQKYIDWDGSIAFPPPSVGQFQKFYFILFGLYAAKVVDVGDNIVPVLYNAYIFSVGIHA